MGKVGNAKKRFPVTPSQPLDAFLTPPAHGLPKAPEGLVSPKMAEPSPIATEQAASAEALSALRQEMLACFAKVEATITSSIATALGPIKAELQDIKANLQAVTQTADSAMELGLAAQDSAKAFEDYEAWATNKIMLLENSLKAANLKIRGIPEGAEELNDLCTFISGWLATKLDLEEGIAPLLTAAYRIGQIRKGKNAWPRDIIISIPDQRVRRKIMEVARAAGGLSYDDHPIAILQDLTAETLETRRRLKPLTNILVKHGIRYRWHQYTKLKILFKGGSLIAEDWEAAFKIISDLGIQLPEDLRNPEDQRAKPIWSKA